MNKTQKTAEIVYILDKSGSMYSYTADTIGGFNSSLHKQKEDVESGVVTTVLFDNHHYTLHDRLPLNDIPDITAKEYNAGGSTALLDTLGDTISHIEKVHHYIRKEDIPEQTIFVIITDGMENASTEYSLQQVKSMISEKQKNGWEFVFLGANIDAIETAGHYGIDAVHTTNFCQDEAGIELAFESVSEFVKSRTRAQKDSSAMWKNKVEADYNSRGKK